MRSSALLVVALFLMFPAVGDAQTSLTISTSPNVVSGLPYTAVRTSHVVRTLADGSMITQDFDGREARDSAGRVYEDSRLVPKAQDVVKSPATVMTVYDPTARTLLQWNSVSKRAMLLHLPQPPVHPLQAGDDAKQPEELGQQEIAGLLATGKRTVTVIPAGRMGNDAPITETRETWTVEDLKITVREVSKNPQQGERTSELSDIKRGEPDAMLFRLPEGYEITEHTLGAPGGARGGTLDGKDDAQYQAMIQQAQQDTGTAVKDDVAYKLAVAKVDIPEAHALAEQAVKQLENESAGVDADKLASADFNRMMDLSRAWHTLGFIYFREGQFETAAKYMKAAWDLEPLGYFAYHLGNVYEEEGDPQKAIAAYRLALTGEKSAKEESLIQDRLQGLAGTVEPVAGSAAVLAVPNRKHLAGSAVFDVVTSADGEVVKFVSGSDALRKDGIGILKALPAAGFAFPDAGPEKIVRRASVTCGKEGQAQCVVSVWTSKEARRGVGPAASL